MCIIKKDIETFKIFRKIQVIYYKFSPDLGKIEHLVVITDDNQDKLSEMNFLLVIKPHKLVSI